MSLMLFAHKTSLKFPARLNAVSRSGGFASRVPVEDSPAGAAHAADSLEVFDEISPILILECLCQGAARGERSRTPFELREIQFVQTHAVEFERLAADKFPERERILLGAFLCVLD